MSQIITSLLDASTWETIFGALFFFGLFFFILAIFSSLNNDDGVVHGDTDGDLIDFDGDGLPDGIDIDGDGSIDVHMDTHVSIDTDHSLSHSLDQAGHEINHGFDHLNRSGTIKEKGDGEYIVLDSKYKMGEYASFSMFTGMTGWFYANNFSDLQLLLALAIGYIAMKSFAFIIANYTQTVTKAVRGVSRGDIAQVRYFISPQKAGLVTIFRKDGVMATELARGAFPYDSFEKGEKAYVWDRTEKGIYLITRGIIGQPDLNTTKKSSSKALDKAMDTKDMDTKALDTKALDKKAMD